MDIVKGNRIEFPIYNKNRESKAYHFHVSDVRMSLQRISFTAAVGLDVLSVAARIVVAVVNVTAGVIVATAA